MSERVGLLHARVRVEERMLIDALEERGVEVELLDARTLVLDPEAPSAWLRFDVVLDRCLALTQSLAVGDVLGSWGIPVVNPVEVTRACADKAGTTLRLARAQVPMPRSVVATGPEAALDAMERLGYPVVLKPNCGSWGRLLARVNDRDAAEAIVEHKCTLGSVQHGVFYIQEHVDKPGRDLRAFVIGGRTVAAISRTSEHWVTNTARGATTERCEVTDDLDAICRATAQAMGTDLCAVDLLECPTRGLLVNEVNSTMEFRNSVEPTGVDLPGLIIEHALNHSGVQA